MKNRLANDQKVSNLEKLYNLKGPQRKQNSKL